MSYSEAINDHMKVFSPKIWIVLAAVVVLLIGACVWGPALNRRSCRRVWKMTEWQRERVYLEYREKVAA